ncbi:T9SS type A sorting domain-containing protein [Adhaeribacter sp. BT258]|uniref:T9SS type A sorting domain-containing protein n=1 Tax=Adhaeribacter terrigena TaxID=2793070 RepID=A0ABS1C3T3_9BACT|nr:T9SS type A sorting domain-containing protein [Adhaeribacter terrigena]MBK0404067.1 T9SS type A sorting domain-containing protein [Adhaeribacter terrigena]
MKKLLFLFLLLGLTSIFSQAQHFHWAKTTHDSSFGSNVASTGNLVITFSTVSHNLRAPIFTLAAHDTSGNILWSKNIFGRRWIQSIYELTPAVTIDNQQQAIIAGSFRDSLSIDTLIYKAPALNGSMFFLAKFDNRGTLRWARTSAFNATQFIGSVNPTSDVAGNIYLSGLFSGTLSFGNISIQAAGTQDAFLIKYDANGNFLWAKATGTQEEEYSVKSKALPNGSVYLVSGISYPSKQVIQKFNTNGNLIWSRTIAPGGGSSITGNNTNIKLEVDKADNLYLTGNYTGSLDFTNSVSLTSLNPKIFLAKYSASGTFKWAKDLASGNNFTTTVPAIFYSGDNTLAIAGAFNGTANFDQTPLSSTPVNSFNGFIVKTDTAGTLLWTKTIPAISGTNEAFGISGNNKGTYFITGLFTGGADFSGGYLNSLTRKTYMAQLKAVSGPVVTGSTYNLVTGNVFFDKNMNGIKDPDETGAAETFIKTNTNEISNIISPEGTYNMLLPGGNYTLIPSPKKHHNLTPATRRISLSGSNQTLSAVDFALQAIPQQVDVAVDLTNLTPARPGFGFSYLLTFKNPGTTTVSDTLTMLYDPLLLNFVNSTTLPATQQTGKLSWYYANLQPNESRTIRVNFQLSVSAPRDSVLQATASIKPLTTDLFQADNFDTARVVITGSFDPNDKQVNKQMLSKGEGMAGAFLEYTIRFQNTGTDTAFTVVVSDKIATGLQVHTLEMVAASHPYVLKLYENNRLEWRFNNILLPDSNRNEPASHGFIKFKIKSKPGLVSGDSITNQAAIYFDYNAPIITNYAVTRVKITTGSGNAPILKLYPNPAKNYVIVAAEFKKNTAATVSLVNLLGQKLSKVTLPANNQIHYQLPLKELPKGVYLIRLETETGLQTQRLVIQ